MNHLNSDQTFIFLTYFNLPLSPRFFAFSSIAFEEAVDSLLTSDTFPESDGVLDLVDVLACTSTGLSSRSGLKNFPRPPPRSGAVELT